MILTALALGVWALYLCTVAPTVTVDDTGDFSLAAHFFGAAHPPGYPVFVLLGRLFHLLPLGGTAFRINLLAAFMGVLAVVLLYLLVEEILGGLSETAGYIPPTLAALLLAGSRTFWRLSTYAEVATASAAVTLGILIVVCRWRRSGRFRYLAAAAYLLGVSFGVHYLCCMTVGIFAGCLMAAKCCRMWLGTSASLLTKLVYSVAGMVRNYYPQAVICVLLFILGTSVFLALPLRSQHGPRHDWGESRSYASLVEVLKRSQYADKASFEPGGRMSRSLVRFTWLFKGLRDQFGEAVPVSMFIGAVCLMVLGLLSLLKNDRLLGVSVVLSAVLPWALLSWVLDIVLTPLRFFYVKVFMVSSFALAFALAGLGVAYIVHIVSTFRRSMVMATVLSAALLIYPAAVITGNFTVSSRRDNLSYYDTALGSLKVLSPDDLLLVRGDPYTFCTWYMQLALNRYGDKAVLNTRLVHLPWYRRALAKRHPALGVVLEPLFMRYAGQGSSAWKPSLVRAWLKRGRAVFSQFNDELSQKEWSLEPWGLVYRVHPAARPFDLTKTCRTAGRLWSRSRVRGLRVWPAGARLSDTELADHVGNCRYNTGTACFAAGRFDWAAKHFEEAARLIPARSDIRANLGSALYKLNRGKEALESFEAAVAHDPSLVVGWQNLIVLLSLRNEHGKARETASRAAAALRRHPEKSLALVRNLEHLGHPGPAGIIKQQVAGEGK